MLLRFYSTIFLMLTSTFTFHLYYAQSETLSETLRYLAKKAIEEDCSSMHETLLKFKEEKEKKLRDEQRKLEQIESDVKRNPYHSDGIRRYTVSMSYDAARRLRYLSKLFSSETVGIEALFRVDKSSIDYMCSSTLRKVHEIYSKDDYKQEQFIEMRNAEFKKIRETNIDTFRYMLLRFEFMLEVTLP